MRAASASLTLACCVAAAAIGFGGCGGSSETVSVAQSPTVAHTAANRATGPSGTTGATGAAGTTAGGAGTNGGTGSAGGAGGTPAGTTRTAPAPAFVERGGTATGAGGNGSGAAAAGLPAALAVVRAQGYTAKDTSDYHAGQTLRVLIGAGARSNDGYDRRAFFFVGDRYIGTDASSPSAQVSVVSQGDTEVTLAYALYHPGDALCCPGGGQARVRFQLNNGRLVPLDAIPPVASGGAPSRR